MPTIITHGLFAISLAHVFKDSSLPPRFWVLAVACSMLPDLDVISFSLGVKYGDFWGHRGFSHSLAFALAASLIIVLLAFFQEKYRPLRLRLVLFFSLVTASHGLFDAMTNGDLGIAFFAPFDNSRYFLPYRPIQVSPIGLHDLLKWGDWRILSNEIKWIVLPSFVLLMLSMTIRYKLKAGAQK